MRESRDWQQRDRYREGEGEKETREGGREWSKVSAF
jgi:hypothetical protein